MIPATTYYTGGDTGEVIPFRQPNGTQAPQHLNGGTHEPPGAGRPSPTSTPPKANDPLASMTPWQIYQKCIWVSDEDAYVKIMLLCISRYMGKDLHAASMAYSQIARDCGFSQETAKKCAKRVAGIWLKIGVQKGRYVPGKGNQNLYDGIIPEKWANEVRQRILGGDMIEPDKEIAKAVDEAMANKTGVSNRHPEGEFRGVPETGVSEGHPAFGVSDRPGCLTDTTGVSESPPYFRYTDKKKTLSGADAPGAGTTDLFAGGAPDQGGTSPESGASADGATPENPSSVGANGKRTAPRRATEEQFARFWAPYPIKEAKAKAKRNFLALSHDDAEWAVAASPAYAAKIRAKQAKDPDTRIKWAQGWLTDRRFEDFPDLRPGAASAAPQSSGRQPDWWRKAHPNFFRAMGVDGWRHALTQHASNGTWDVELLGPPPSSTGCVIPRDFWRDLADILDKFKGPH